MDWLLPIFNPDNSYFQQLLALATSILFVLMLRSFKTKLVNHPRHTLIGSAVSAFYVPAKVFLVALVFYHVVDLINVIANQPFDIKQYPILQLLAIIHVGWYGFRTVNTYEKATLDELEPTVLDATAVIGVAKVLRLLLVVICLIVAFDLLGLDPRGLIALGSVSGAALAFASRDLVSNWFGGVMLYLDKPFKVGDWIRSPDREIEGTVEYIGWRITKIMTFDKRPLYVPNSMFNNITVQNPSRMSHRRIKETIGVRYEDMTQVDGIVQAVRKYLTNSEFIDQDEVIIVNFNGFGASSLNLMIYCMTINTDWVQFHHEKEKVLLDIADIVQSHGADFAFPTQTVHLETATDIPSEGPQK